MRAVRFHGPGDLRVEEVPKPEQDPGDVLVQVDVALTDGTDFKAYRRGHPVLMNTLPSPFGHEFCGVDVGSGQRVVAANSNADGRPLGELELLNGAYAEFVLVPERIARVNLLPVPPGLESEVAAMVEPLACCLRAIDVGPVRSGDCVTILGAGPIGLMLAACVVDAGAAPTIVGGRPERRALAPLFGARPGEGRYADVVIEAAGTIEAWDDAIAFARPGGTVVFFGGLPEGTRVEVDAFRLHYEELTLRGSFHHTPQHVRAALTFLASGAYPWERLVTHHVSLDALPALFAGPPRDLLKAAVIP